SAVEGLNYRTATQAGMTNQEGEFTYQAGESIIFSIGDIDFPSVDAEEQLTPLDIFQTADYENVGVVNMLRLLQTLDEDGVAGNGIVIASNVHSDAAGLTLDFTAPDFDSMVATLVANSGSPLVALIGAEQAINHLRTSLDDEVAVACGSDHAKVGFSGSLSTLAHNVSGTATIIDNCTIQITAFNYDGGGPQVYFYAADNFMFGSDDAFSISGAINGQTYVDRTLVYSLPNGKTLDDFDTLSVWCSDFNANFGDLIFAAP
ncbi:MAG: DM13 domain-containing protein, partial [Spongiibacteraceae bacterium]|nr:DM13 domain-containing protein [Spongiibacteraceae bacterium]